MTSKFFNYILFELECWFTFLLLLNLQVAKAASVNASAVLIYPDPADYSFDEETDLFGHVCTGYEVTFLFSYIYLLLYCSDTQTHTRSQLGGNACGHWDIM